MKVIFNNILNVVFAMLMVPSIGRADANGRQYVLVKTDVDTLKVGDPAPRIVVRKWLKGTPVTSFKPGMVYVVEFWATWCGPCQAAMPHLSELAGKYKGKAEVLSFDVKEDKKTDFLPKVERFVKYSGNRMSYTVAVDAADDTMERTWLKAAGSSGIPELFIVDQQGKIAWHGHPNFVDDVLDAVVNGNYDEAGKKRIEAAAKEKEERYNALSKKMMIASKDGNYQEALAIVEDLLPVYPGMQNYLLCKKYEFLSRKDSSAGRQLGEELMSQWTPKDQLALAFWIVVTRSDGSFKPDYEFALKWAKQAAAHSDPGEKGVVKLLGQLYYAIGDKKRAIDCQKKFIQMLRKDGTNSSNVLKPEEETLQRYKQ
ncbi:Thiol-disulfide isomerase or thioredoxin [Chitinophaga sp. CF118]|nr:Thiol-disulfide isomerase or thioredoxin [Chitinophaga sp. CF118]